MEVLGSGRHGRFVLCVPTHSEAPEKCLCQYVIDFGLEGWELIIWRAGTPRQPSAAPGLWTSSCLCLCPAPRPPLFPLMSSRPCGPSRAPGFLKGGDRLQRSGKSWSVILFLWFSFQAVTVNLFYLSLCKSLCRIKPFTSF